MIFSFASLDKAEPFDSSWADLYAQDVCAIKGSTVQGGLGPFGLLTLASKNLEEYTPVFFRVFKAHDNYKVLMCSDASRYVLSSPKKKKKNVSHCHSTTIEWFVYLFPLMSPGQA